MGQPIAHIGSTTSGHGPCNPPSSIKTSGGNATVYVNKMLVATKGATAVTHGCKDDPPHNDVVVKGSMTVMIMKKWVARQGDKLDRGSTITSGFANVTVGG